MVPRNIDAAECEDTRRLDIENEWVPRGATAGAVVGDEEKRLGKWVEILSGATAAHLVRDVPVFAVVLCMGISR